MKLMLQKRFLLASLGLLTLAGTGGFMLWHSRPLAEPVQTGVVKGAHDKKSSPSVLSSKSPPPSPSASPTANPKTSKAAKPTPAKKAPATSRAAAAAAAAAPGLNDPAKKIIAMKLVSSAENSSLDWQAQYRYIQDIGDGRGYTAGIVGFCSGTGDMLAVVKDYRVMSPGSALAAYVPALQAIMSQGGGASHAGLDPGLVGAWQAAANDPAFRRAQDNERDRTYFNPAVTTAKGDGLRALGQFIYYDAAVMHGPGRSGGLLDIRAAALQHAKSPAQGGNEAAYLNAFLDARKAAMLTEAAHDDTSRVDTMQRVFVQAGNLDLAPPLRWKTYGDSYAIN